METHDKHQAEPSESLTPACLLVLPYHALSLPASTNLTVLRKEADQLAKSEAGLGAFPPNFTSTGPSGTPLSKLTGMYQQTKEVAPAIDPSHCFHGSRLHSKLPCSSVGPVSCSFPGSLGLYVVLPVKDQPSSSLLTIWSPLFISQSYPAPFILC